MSTPDSLAAAVDRALEAYEALGLLGEEQEDEWMYVSDLTAAWRERLVEVASTRGGEPLGEPLAAAIDTAIEEIGLVSDPNRAIDWLSTFPQVVLVALGERA